MLQCENYSDLEIILGSYEEFVIGYKPLKAEDGMVTLSQSFANHSHRASVRCVASGGRFMASGGADDNIQLYDMKLRKEMGVLMHHEKTVTCVAFVGTSHLISGSEDGDVVIWRSGNWQCEKIWTAHKDGGVTSIAVHPSGKLCLTVGRDQTLKTWNLVKGRSAYTTNLHAQGEDLSFSESGEHYAVLKLMKGGAQFSVDVYSIVVAGVVYSVVPESRPSSITFLKDDFIAIGTDTGSVEIHQISKKSCVCKFKTKSTRIRKIGAVQFSSGEAWLVTAASNGEICIYSFKKISDEEDLGSPKLIGSVSAGCRPTCLALVLAPVDAVQPKVKAEEEEKKVLVPFEKKVTNKRGTVTVELEDSDEEDRKLAKVNKLRNKKKKVQKKQTNNAEGEGRKTKKNKNNVKNRKSK
ncbi:Hypothetical predicted protein [Cloeon dipterum]|uniref:Anaphase-promoting complex subunit 4 WD40 domain-containing protein n=1 Tax=Cloeon dipterum TaxID=197152 RepID=A0A8S1CL77_9INSE|nr:Hypothetical predicted protein [Cloeon dipterum]CAB3368433.1 Hypothetical predicted protein [Cloeon dipterum]